MRFVIHLLASGAVLSATALGCVGVASADPTAPLGNYNFTGRQAGDPNVWTNIWTFTDCGKDCVTANADDAVVKNWQFHLKNGTWSSSSNGVIPCFSGGGQESVSYTATIDAATLTGQWTRKYHDAVCGGDPGTVDQETFELTPA
jgi:hypothetical protein